MIATLVLAGGLASRMGGGDKPLLELGGRTLIARIMERIAGPVAISANGDPARFAAFGCPVLGDGEHAGQGPLAGVLAGLGWAASLGADALLTVPGDTPFIPRGLAGALAPAPAWAVSGGRCHTLVALWQPLVRERLMASLSEPGSRSVTAFGEALGMRTVVFATEPFDPFLNVNTPADLVAAQALAP